MKTITAKKSMCFILIGILAADILTACGNLKKESMPTEETAQELSVSSEDIAVKNIDVIGSAVSNDYLYIAASMGNKEDDKEYLHQYHLQTGQKVEWGHEQEMDLSIQLVMTDVLQNPVLLLQGENNTAVLQTLSAADGSVVTQIDITEQLKGNNVTTIRKGILDRQNNCYLHVNISELLVLNPEGETAAHLTSQGSITDIFMNQAGDVVAAQLGIQGMELRAVDLSGKEWGTALPAPSQASGYYAGKDGELLVNTGSKLVSYLASQGAEKEVFDWISENINSEEILNLGQLQDGRFWVLLADSNSKSSGYEVQFLSENAAPVLDKTEITMGVVDNAQVRNIQKSVVAFNKQSKQYQVRLEKYADDVQLEMALVSGKGPDLIDVSVIGGLNKYEAKGILENLSPYMEQDHIAREDYTDSVLQANERNGKLYAIMPTYMLLSLAAKKADFPEGMKFTLTDFLDLGEKESDEEFIYEPAFRTSVFNICMFYNMDEFIDWDTGECHFDSEEFSRMLTYVKQYPDTMNDREDTSISKQIQSGKAKFLLFRATNVWDFQLVQGIFGEEVTLLGFPGNAGNEANVSPTFLQAAMNAHSKNKEGAWEYLKFLLSDEYQNLLAAQTKLLGFPVKKTALDNLLLKEAAPENFESRDKTAQMYDFSMKLQALSVEDTERIKELLYTAGGSAYIPDRQVRAIIEEEAEIYFQGGKNEKDTMDVIQRRVQIYVDENR